MSDYDKMSQHQVLGVIAEAVKNTDATDGIALALGSIAHNLSKGNGLTDAIDNLAEVIEACGSAIAESLDGIAKAISEKNS